MGKRVLNKRRDGIKQGEPILKRLLKAQVSQDDYTLSKFILLILIAYAFSFLCRLIWVFKHSSYEQLHWNGEFIPLTHDSFYFAKQAYDALNYGTPAREALSILTVYISKVLPFIKFETIIFYMPAVVGPLIVIPLMLIGRLFGHSRVGFFSALISSITVSYYNRTMGGYYDTDMLNVTMPLLIMFFMMATVMRQRLLYMVLTVATCFLFSCWYVAGVYLIALFCFTGLLYLFIFDRKNAYAYMTLLLSMISAMPIPIVYRLLAVTLLVVLFLLYKDKGLRIVYTSYSLALILALLLYMSIPSLSDTISKHILFVKTFFIKPEQEGLKYFDFTSVTGELERPNIIEFSERISGNLVIFLLSLIGCLLYFSKNLSSLLLLPMLGLGLMSFFIGARYSVYAVPVAGMGFAYLIFLTTSIVEKKAIKYLLVSSFTIVALLFNVRHIVGYQNPIIITSKEIEALQQLKNIAEKEAYVFSWWDYGYAIQYYTGLRTLTDGGRNSKNGYIESLILSTDNQTLAYNLTKESASLYDATKSESLIEVMVTNLSVSESKSPNELISEMSSKDYKIRADRPVRVYLCLKYQMIDIFDSIIRYSNRDLMTGQEKRRHIFYPFYNVGNTESGRLILGDRAYIDLSRMEAKLDKASYLIKDFYIISEDRTGQKHINKRTYNVGSTVNAILLKRLRTLLILDEITLNSLFIQFFVFDNYEVQYYEPVITNPLVKIFVLR